MLEEFINNHTVKQSNEFRACMFGYYNGIGKKHIIEQIQHNLETYLPNGTHDEMCNGYLKSHAKWSTVNVVKEDNEDTVIKELMNGLRICSVTKNTYKSTLNNI